MSHSFINYFHSFIFTAIYSGCDLYGAIARSTIKAALSAELLPGKYETAADMTAFAQILAINMDADDFLALLGPICFQVVA
jgi:hypothetical protein